MESRVWSSPVFFSSTIQPNECQYNSFSDRSSPSVPKPLHKYWIFTYFFPLKAMTLVTLLENTLHAHRNKRKEEKERQEKCAKPYNSIWASIWNIFLSNKLAARVVSKIVLIVFVLWWVPNILETSSHFFNLCNPQWSIWLYVYKYLRPSIPYTWKSASP